MNAIDCHVNCGWDVSNTRKNLFPTGQTYKKLLHKMDMADITKAIILPFPSPGGQFNQTAPWYDLENNYLIQATTYSKKLIPFPAVNPADPRSVHGINTLALTHNIKGIKFSHQIPMNFSIDRLIRHPLMKIVQEYKLLMMMHVGTGKEKGAENVSTTLPYAMSVAKAYPDTTFIFCHLGRLHKDTTKALELPNVYMDTAGLALWENWPQFIAKEPSPAFQNARPVEVIEKLVDAGHENKILFGSDEPYTSYKIQLSHITDADIPERVKQKMLHKNMVKLLDGKN
jgi:predicted TIM-barrel fold metal-dependent hydrolase